MRQEVEKYLSGEMDAAEQKVFLERASRDADLRGEIVRMKTLQAFINLSSQPGDEVFARKKLRKLTDKLNLHRKQKLIVNILKYAAVVAVLVIATWMSSVYYASHDGLSSFTEIEVPKGQCVNLTLADGSKVWLSPQSKLRIPERFNSSTLRTVELDGGAYFVVSHDEEKPFVVQTGRYNIQVLGTEFQVFAYSKRMKRFETYLVKGKVKVYDVGNEEESVYLEADEKVQLMNDHLVKQSPALTGAEYALDGVFSFRKKTIKEILDYLSLWYDVHFMVCETVDLNRRISGKFYQNSEVTAILDALKESYDFDYRKTGEDSFVIFK